VRNLSAMQPAEADVEPTQEELVAVVSAAVARMLLAQPRSHPPANDPASKALPWRFSGRWWATPLVLRRERPIA